MLCKKTEFKLKKLVREYNCEQKPCINCTFKFMQLLKKMIFHAFTYVVRLQKFSFAMSTHICSVLSIEFVKKSGIECVFSDPRNVLRHKQGRLTL